MALTIEQERIIAIANARARMADAEAAPKPEPTKREVLDEALARARKEGGMPAPASARTAFDPNASYLDEAGRAVKNMIPSAGRAIDATARGVFHDIPNAIAHPIKTGKAIAEGVETAGEIAAGGLDRNNVFGLKGKSNVGTAKYDEFANANWEKFGTGKRIAHTLADDPFVPAAIVATGGRALLKKLPPGVLPKVSLPSAPAAVTDTLNAGRRAKQASAWMRGDAEKFLTAEGTAATEAAAAAEAKAARVAAIREKLVARRTGLSTRAAEQSARSATPAPPTVGTPGHLADFGDQARTASLKNFDEAQAALKESDTVHRAEMLAEAKAKADQGIGVSDVPEGKELLARSKAALNPDPIRGTGVGLGVSDEVAKLHKRVVKSLEPKRTYIEGTTRELQQLKNSGRKVFTDPNTNKLYIVTKPSLENVDVLRRWLGQVQAGKIEKYKAIAGTEGAKLYAEVSDVMDKYVDGLSAKVQENYKLGKERLATYEKLKEGQRLVGMQKGIPVPTVEANRIPGQIIAGGRDSVAQARAVAGAAPIDNMVRGVVQNELNAAKKSGDVNKLLQPGNPLAEIIAADPSLESAVRGYHGQRVAAEEAGASAKELTGRVGTTDTRLALADKLADQLTGSKLKATQRAGETHRELAQLALEGQKHPDRVASRYRKLLDEAHSRPDNPISEAQYTAGLELANTADDAFKTQATRNAWIRGAGVSLGMAPVGGAAFGAMGVLGGLGIGVGAGVGGRAIRRGLGKLVKR
jgi:hypothetical protein